MSTGAEGGATDRWDVLAVDDEPVVLDGIRMVLEAEGLRVATAGDAATALAHPALATCRMAICDLMLPDQSGLDLVASMRKKRPDLRVVLMTGYATPEQVARALDSEMCVFLGKPFEESELLAVVRPIIGAGDSGSKRRDS